MAAKARLTVFAVAVLFPIFIVCINLKAFWTATAILMTFFSAAALKELVIVNFASDAFYEKHMNGKIQNGTPGLILTDAILVCGAYALIIIMLFISSFMLKNHIMKGFSLLLLGLWAVDFHKVFAKPQADEQWTYKDTLKEIVMWAQSSLSIIFAVISAFMI